MKILKNLKRPLAIILLGCIQIMGPTLSMEAVRSNLGEEDPADPPFNSADAKNQVVSQPFVADDGYVYFQGISDQLWKVNAHDGSGRIQLGAGAGDTTKSPPFIFMGSAYFRGTDNSLRIVSTTPGAGSRQIVNYETIGSPFVYAYSDVKSRDQVIGVFHCGSNGGLYSTDGTNLTEYGAMICAGPYVSDNWIYCGLVRIGEGSALWRIKLDQSSSNTYEAQTHSTPFPYKDYVYHQGTDNGLYRINTSQQLTKIGGNYTLSSPFVYDDYVYFRGTDNKLYCVQVSQPDSDNPVYVLIGNYCGSAPYVFNDWVYFQGESNLLKKVRTYSYQWPVTFNLYVGFHIDNSPSPNPVNITIFYHNSTSGPSNGWTSVPVGTNQKLTITSEGDSTLPLGPKVGGKASPMGEGMASMLNQGTNFTDQWNISYNSSNTSQSGGALFSFGCLYKYMQKNSQPCTITLSNYPTGATISTSPQYVAPPPGQNPQTITFENGADIYLFFYLGQ